jgi:hypothetical protein
MSRAVRAWYKHTGTDRFSKDFEVVQRSNFNRFLETLAMKLDEKVRGGDEDVIPAILGGSDLLEEMIEEKELEEGLFVPESDSITAIGGRQGLLPNTFESMAQGGRSGKKHSASTVDDNLRTLFGLQKDEGEPISKLDEFLE